VTLWSAAGYEGCRARRVVDADELVRVLGEPGRATTRAFLSSQGLTGEAAELLRERERILLVAFDPTDEPTPPPLHADLVWMWIAATAVTFVLRRRR
jgi:hypothetical protein